MPWNAAAVSSGTVDASRATSAVNFAESAPVNVSRESIASGFARPAAKPTVQALVCRLDESGMTTGASGQPRHPSRERAAAAPRRPAPARPLRENRSTLMPESIEVSKVVVSVSVLSENVGKMTLARC
jgi:hypothetical protein